jgi:hypothetical protein
VKATLRGPGGEDIRLDCLTHDLLTFVAADIRAQRCQETSSSRCAALFRQLTIMEDSHALAHNSYDG